AWIFIAATHDPQEAISIDLIFEFAQQPVDRAYEAVSLVRAKTPRIEHRACRVHRVDNQGLLQIVGTQQRVERGVARDPRLDGLDLRGEDDVRMRQRRRLPDRLLPAAAGGCHRACRKEDMGPALQYAGSLAE